MTDHPLVQPLLHGDQFLPLPLHEVGDGNPRPGRNRLGDILLADLLLQEPPALLNLSQFPTEPFEFGLKCGKATVSELGDLLQLPLPLEFFLLGLDLVQSLLGLADPADNLLLPVPLGLLRLRLLPEVSQFSVHFAESFGAGGVALFGEGLSLYFQLDSPPFQGVHLQGHGIDLDSELSGGLIHKVDRFIRKLTIRKVPVGERRGGDQGGIFDLDPVEGLVPLLEPAEDGDGVLHRRLGHEDRLKTAFQGGVLLHILLVFVEGRRPDGLELSPGQGGLENVGGVHGPLRRAGADDGMHLIDEEDDLPFTLENLLHHGLQPLLELASELRPRQEGSHVQGEDSLVLQRVGNIAVDDSLGQPLDDSGFSNPRLADEGRVVLLLPRENLDHRPHLVVPADDGVELPRPGHLGEVLGVPLESLELLLRVLVRNPVASPQLPQGRQEVLLLQPPLLEEPRRGLALLFKDGQEKMLRRDVLILENLRLLGGRNEKPAEGAGHHQLPPLGPGQFFKLFQKVLPEGGGGEIRLGQKGGNQPFGLIDQGKEEMLRRQLGVSPLLSLSLGLLKGLLGLEGILIEVSHGSPP